MSDRLQRISSALYAYEVTFAHRLTPRQHQIAVWICAGYTTKEISELAGIAQGTVDRHGGEIYIKAGIFGKTISKRTILISNVAFLPE